MAQRKKTIIILLAIVCFALIGLLFSMGYEKEMQRINESKANQTKIEDKYFEKAEKLGIEEDRILLNSITRNFKKANNKDRVYKLVSSMLSEYNYLINTQQLEKAYNMLDDEYINEFNLNYNIFKAKNKGELIDKYVITSIEEIEIGSIILVEYIIVRDSGFVKEKMSIVEKNGEYTLTLNGLSEKTTMAVEQNIKGIKISVPRRYKVGNSVAYKIIIKNTSDKDMNINNYHNGFFGVVQNQKYSHKILNTINPYFMEDYIVREGETKEYIVMFNTGYYLEKIGIELENKEIIEIQIFDIWN